MSESGAVDCVDLLTERLTIESDDEEEMQNELATTATEINFQPDQILPSSLWFHGPLNRAEAEKRLFDAEKSSGSGAIGHYLVRESDRRPGKYVLSCREHNGSFVHYPITCLCGHFFIDGQEFCSLELLVTSLASSCDSTWSHLTVPVPPAAAVLLNARKIVAKLPFCGMADSDELSFKKGDIFVVDQEIEEGWLWASNERTGESGLVFEGLTEDLSNNNTVPPEKLPYFYDGVPLSSLARSLAAAGIDAFLVKPSERSVGDLTLLLNTGIRIEKFLIKRTKDDAFALGGRKFVNLHDIIDRYSQLEICDGHRLLTPVLKQEPAIESAPERLSICKRLTSRNSCPDAAKAGLAWRKTKEQKKWKAVFLMLKEPDGQLFCFENERHTKPKCILDLCYCQLYVVHDSLFGRPNCFQLLLNALNRSAFYFCVQDPADCQQWLRFLKPLCAGFRLDSSPSASLGSSASTSSFKWRVLRSKIQLTISVHEAKSLPAKAADTDCLCVVAVNGAKISKTAAVASSEWVVWDAQFFIDDAPAGSSSSVQFSVLNRVKTRGRSKDWLIGSATVADFASNNKIEDRWVCLSSSGSRLGWSRSTHETLSAQIKVSVSRAEIHVMPVEEYSSLQQLLIADDFAACHWLGSKCALSDRPRLVTALLNVMSNNSNLHLRLLLAELGTEINATVEPHTIFRSPTFCTALMSCFLKRNETTALVSVLLPFIQQMITEDRVLEIDSSKTDEVTLKQNVLQLVALISGVCRSIFASVSSFSQPMRYVLSQLKRKVSERWPREPLVKLRAVGSFVCLRLFCLALVDQRQFNLVTDSLPRSASRNMVLVAKVVQTIANLSPPTAYQKQELEPIRTFIENAREQMITFLNEISSSCEEPELQPSESSVDSADDLALVFQLASHTLSKSQSETAENESCRQSMSAVVQLLHNHQNMYLAHEPRCII